ncbi:reticulon-like protein B5 [Hibiscus syriacus]|uniref:reticulon-like protein B5 n=1 Tax=Hibiscus syriacus TaxID=106335 RepID=UPI001924DE26|nr:reticulon-like protein B5 [Hibiscus syriacus]
MEKISEKIHSHDSSSESDSDHEKPSCSSTVQSKIFLLFGRVKIVHHVLGGGEPADVFLWRNKKISASVLSGATDIWVLFEPIDYNLLTLICHVSILCLALMFLWPNVHTSSTSKTPPCIPEVYLPEEPFIHVASALTIEINRAFKLLQDVASGRNLK